MAALTVVTGVHEEAEAANPNIEAPGVTDLDRAAAEKTGRDRPATSIAAAAGLVRGQDLRTRADTIGLPEEVGEAETIAKTEEIENGATGSARAIEANGQERHEKRILRVRPSRRHLSPLKTSEIGVPSSCSS